jgi:hypothetical protein
MTRVNGVNGVNGVNSVNTIRLYSFGEHVVPFRKTRVVFLSQWSGSKCEPGQGDNLL